MSLKRSQLLARAPAAAERCARSDFFLIVSVVLLRARCSCYKLLVLELSNISRNFYLCRTSDVACTRAKEYFCATLTGQFCFGSYGVRSWLGRSGVVWLCGIR